MSEIVRSYISISEMAERLKISRVHFYSLLKRGIFPSPIKKEKMRPYYDADLQRQCLEIKEKQTGLDGQPILFYSKSVKPKKQPTTAEKPSKYSFLVDALSELGLSGITAKEVEVTINRIYTTGIAQIAEEDMIRTLFVEFSSS